MNIHEARAILAANEALQRSFANRGAATALFGLDERAAWDLMVNRADEFVFVWENGPRKIIR